MRSQGGLVVDLSEGFERVGREKREVEPWSSLGTWRKERVEKRRRQRATTVRMYMRALGDGLLKYMVGNLKFRVLCAMCQSSGMREPIITRDIR